MDRSGESHDVAGFLLTALVDGLAMTPDEATASRQVSAAASTARSLARVPKTFRWVAAATATVTLLATGGVAMAGGLPAPVQTAVADVARVLPLPISIPYPRAGLSGPSLVDHPEVDTWSQPAPAAEPADEPEDSRKQPFAAANVTPSEHQILIGDVRDQRRCDSDGGQHDGKQGYWACDEFVAPPGFDQDVDRIDRDENGHEEVGDRDRESEADSSSEIRGNDSNHRDHDESDRQEERDHHESPDDDPSTGRT